MQPMTAERRAADIDALAREGVDVLVIGGGITGAGIALDAATRGYRVGLVEKGDFASGTSSWSTKLVHGGIRYLPQGDVPLVHEALVERGRLLRNAPHLVHPLEFVLPLYASSRQPVGLPFALPGGVGLGMILDIGLGMYDLLAGSHNVERHHRLTRDEVLARAPALRPDGLTQGFLYADGQTDDTRLVLAILRSAATVGARLVNYAQVTGFEAGADGRLAAAQVHLTGPQDGGRSLTIPARHIVNATGVFAEQVEALIGAPPRLDIEPSKGVHLVLRHSDLAMGDAAVVLPETEDGRIIFLVPWRSRVIVGTTDTGSGDLDHPRADAADVAYLLDHLNRSVARPVARERIVSTYAGYRPLLKLRQGRSTARLSRSHEIVEGPTGLISISGGKLTTYRIMAQEVVDRIDARTGNRTPCATEDWPLAGAVGWPAAAADLAKRAAMLGLSAATTAHLATSYGALAQQVLDLVAEDPALAAPLDPDLPAIRAEVDYAARAELALTVTDVLERRLRLGIEAADHGVGAAPYVAARLAGILGWDAATRDQQIAAYVTYAALHDGGIAGDLTSSAGS
jgi:glycerol-3-phosphate dehydrogenase